MTTVVEPADAALPTAAAGASIASRSGARPGSRGEAPDSEPIIVALTAADAKSMPRSVPRLLRRVRNERARLNEADNQASVPVTVDLSALPVLGPAVCAQLLLLIGLLREVAAPGQVALVGVASTLRSCLAAGLPDGVRLVDRRGRVWGR